MSCGENSIFQQHIDFPYEIKTFRVLTKLILTRLNVYEQCVDHGRYMCKDLNVFLIMEHVNNVLITNTAINTFQHAAYEPIPIFRHSDAHFVGFLYLYDLTRKLLWPKPNTIRV
jgi:hypothetical protein